MGLRRHGSRSTPTWSAAPCRSPISWHRASITGAAYTHPDFCIGCGNGLVRFDTHDVGVVVLDWRLRR